MLVLYLNLSKIAKQCYFKAKLKFQIVNCF